MSTGIRFSEEVYNSLKAEADERDLSINYLVNRAVVEFLDNLIPVDEVMLTRPRVQSRRYEIGQTTRVQPFVEIFTPPVNNPDSVKVEEVSE